MKKPGSWLLLILFLLYYSSAFLFIHTHFIDGVAIVHSHFYKFPDQGEKPGASHQHTPEELGLIDVLSSWTSDARQYIADCTEYPTGIVFLAILPSFSVPSSHFLLSRSLRSPPFFA